MTPSRMRKPKRRTTQVRSTVTRNGNEKDRAFHVLLRVRSELGQTIAAHKEIIARRGVALLGKMGEPLGRTFKDELNQQIDHGLKTYLFLTTREGWNGPYVTDRCLLGRVYDTLDPMKHPLVPRYYAADIPRIRTWFEIASMDRLSREEMNRLVVLSSGREIMSVIASSATVFRVAMNPRPK
jgi:hypothetical protein